LLRPRKSLLDVTTGAAGFSTAGTLTGNVNVGTDSAIEFLSGQISTIAAGSQLRLGSAGNSAFIEDSTALGSNSALTGLGDIAGSLDLVGAAVTTTGSVTNSDRRAAGYHDVRVYARYASRAPVVRVVPIRTDSARPCRFAAHDAPLTKDAAVTASDDESLKPMDSVPVLVNTPRIDKADPPPPECPSTQILPLSVSDPIVDSEAP
jgi:hypothetical protein